MQNILTVFHVRWILRNFSQALCRVCGGMEIKMKKEEGKAAAPKDIRISMTKQKARKQRQKRIFGLMFFLLFLCVTVIIVILALFLKIDSIEVMGNVKYNSEGIIAASGINMGDSIITVGGSQTEKNIKSSFPSIKRVEVKKHFPSGIILNVEETDEVMFVAVGQQYYSLDSELNVAEKYDSIETVELMGLKRIYLPEITRCITGEKIQTTDNDIHEMVKLLYESLVKYELFHDISEIDFRDKFDISFTLGVKYTVKLGSTLECDTKLEFLCGIISKLRPDDIGTIDFSDGDINEAVFSRG